MINNILFIFWFFYYFFIKFNINNIERIFIWNFIINKAFFFFFCTNDINCLKVKFFLFFVIEFSLLLLFWYYLSCFCAVYKNTQIHLIKDTLISFGLSLVYPLLLYLIPGVFRIPALRAKKANMECLYKFSKMLQLIWNIHKVINNNYNII